MRNWKFRYSLIVSIAVHLVLVLSTIVLPKMFKPAQREIVEISYAAPPPPMPLPVEVEKKKQNRKAPLIKQQVVDQDDKAVNDEVPVNTKFLSAHNQVVKKQTVAEKLGDFKNRKEKNSMGDGGAPKLMAENLKPKLDFAKMIEKKQQQEKELERTLDENAMKVADQQKVQKNPRSNSDKIGATGADSSQTSDYLKDVERGAETLLSTREFVYYSFYARIRRQLNQHWGGKVREKIAKILKEGRSIASSDDKVTRLMITLNRKGQLVKVQVLSDSGVRDLDDAAVEAFQEAAPFPNPPAGIVESDGTIKIRWDFILEA
jgi:protein TonB